MGELVLDAIAGRWSRSPERAALLASTRGNSRRDQRARRWLTALDAVEFRAWDRTQDEVGRLMGGLSRQRIEQMEAQLTIVSGLPIHDLLVAERASRRRAHELDVFERAVALLRSTPGLSPHDVADRAGASVAELRRILGPTLGRALAEPPRRVTVRWSPGDAENALRAASDLRGSSPLTAPFYASLVASGRVEGPSAATIRARFGTWRESLEAAGVEGRDWAGGLKRRWSDDQILAALVEYFVTTPVGRWSAEDYGAASAVREDMPSLTLMKLRFRDSTWTRLKAAALAECRRPDRHPRYVAVIDPVIDERGRELTGSV